MEERRLSQEQNLKDFIVVASHELRHPMAIIKGYSSILRQHSDSLGDDERNSILDSIEKGVDRLSRLASELLDVANIEQGRFDSTGGSSDVAELVEKAIAQVSERNDGREYIMRVSSSMPPVPVGPVALLLCLVHLIDNAVNFSVEGPVEIVGKTDEEGVKIQVLDRGIGVPEGQRRMIFSRFYRAVEARHHSVPGVGLGLFIADRIIRSQGGSVTCDGREGGGTVMTIGFPWEAMPGGGEERLT